MAAATARQLSSIFARYERDKCAFVSAVADAARVEGNAGALAALEAPRLLLPLLTDPCDTVAHTAAFALGRIAGHSRAVATGLSASGVVATLVARAESAATATAEPVAADAGAALVGAKRSLMGMLVSLMRHSPEMAAATTSQGGLAAAVRGLEDGDAETREGAASAVAHLVAHSLELASAACTAGALVPLVACLSVSSSASDTVCTRRSAASALSDIARHSVELATGVVTAGAVGAAAFQLRAPLANDARLKRLLLSMLMYVARADAALADKLVAAGLIPDISRCLKFSDDAVRQGAARCLRDVSRHTPALASAVVNAPGLLAALAGFAASSPSVQALPALLAFGFAAEHSAELAARVAAAPGVLPALVAALQCGDESAQAAAAWALGRIGGHGAALAQAAAAGLPLLSALAASAPEGSDLQVMCLKAACTIIPQLADLGALAALVQEPTLLPALQELLLARCAAVMAKAPASRALFVTSGALGYLESQAEVLPPGCPSAERIATCLRLFPQELLQHFSASHAAKLLASLGSDQPPCDAIPAVHAPAGSVPLVLEAVAPAAAAPDEVLPRVVLDVAVAAGDSSAAMEPSCAAASPEAEPAAAEPSTGGQAAPTNASAASCTSQLLAPAAVVDATADSPAAEPASCEVPAGEQAVAEAVMAGADAVQGAGEAIPEPTAALPAAGSPAGVATEAAGAEPQPAVVQEAEAEPEATGEDEQGLAAAGNPEAPVKPDSVQATGEEVPDADQQTAAAVGAAVLEPAVGEPTSDAKPANADEAAAGPAAAPAAEEGAAAEEDVATGGGEGQAVDCEPVGHEEGPAEQPGAEQIGTAEAAPAEQAKPVESAAAGQVEGPTAEQQLEAAQVAMGRQAGAEELAAEPAEPAAGQTGAVGEADGQEAPAADAPVAPAAGLQADAGAPAST